MNIEEIGHHAIQGKIASAGSPILRSDLGAQCMHADDYAGAHLRHKSRELSAKTQPTTAATHGSACSRTASGIAGAPYVGRTRDHPTIGTIHAFTKWGRQSSRVALASRPRRLASAMARATLRCPKPVPAVSISTFHLLHSCSAPLTCCVTCHDHGRQHVIGGLVADHNNPVALAHSRPGQALGSSSLVFGAT